MRNERRLGKTAGCRQGDSGVSLPWVVLADAGYWHTAQMRTITEREIQVRVSLHGNMRKGNEPGGPIRPPPTMRAS